MIKINYDNILRKKIGFLEGVNEGRLNSFCGKNQKLITQLFKNKNQEGYAFLNLPDDTKVINQIKKMVTQQKKNKWSTIVVLGIGGSALGAIALREALSPTLHLIVLDNIDPLQTHQTLESIDLKKSLFVVISKSGTTVEPMTLYGVIKEKLQKKFPKEYQNHFIFVTDPKKGVLRKIGKEEKIPMLDVPAKVGGRFSVLSAVGLLPFALAGGDINKILKGAKMMRGHIRKGSGIENPALLLAGIQYLMDRKKGKNITVMMPYSSHLNKMSDWYKQLLAESIGKNKKTGPTPVSSLGTTDQHSQIQLYNQGPSDKWIMFLKIEKWAKDLKVPKGMPEELNYLEGKKMSEILNAAHHGTAEALTKNGRPNITLELSELNGETIGALIMLLECQVALLGMLYGVNAFDQPGVEAGKKIMKENLKK